MGNIYVCRMDYEPFPLPIQSPLDNFLETDRMRAWSEAANDLSQRLIGIVCTDPWSPPSLCVHLRISILRLASRVYGLPDLPF